jgi:hypothetical protein
VAAIHGNDMAPEFKVVEGQLYMRMPGSGFYELHIRSYSLNAQVNELVELEASFLLSPSEVPGVAAAAPADAHAGWEPDDGWIDKREIKL